MLKNTNVSIVKGKGKSTEKRTINHNQTKIFMNGKCPELNILTQYI